MARGFIHASDYIDVNVKTFVYDTLVVPANSRIWPHLGAKLPRFTSTKPRHFLHPDVLIETGFAVETITIVLLMLLAVVVSDSIVRVLPLPVPLPLVQIGLGAAIASVASIQRRA